MKTVIIDDEIAAIKQLQKLLNLNKNIKLSGFSNNPQKGIEMVISKKPDIVFVDVEMPVLSGFDVVEKIKEKGQNPAFICTTAYKHYAIKAIKTQVFDYLLKPVDIDELNACIEKVVERKGGLMVNIPTHIKAVLSSRELEVLHLLKQGKNSQEIADRLYISKTTVDTHRRNILEKTGFKSTMELIGML